MSPFDPSSIERPDRALVKYYVITSLIREMILSRLSLSKVTGLGDEVTLTTASGCTTEHLAALREAHDSLQASS